ncbi:hypothetical protein PUN28_013653 [Cardiocondyla obscurior]|uniref:Uncharacterized protein n=1 Tax=Cardiocondyla obscurior TaxID=286306 RepID=A0AAW2F2E0_9HYME
MLPECIYTFHNREEGEKEQRRPRKINAMVHGREADYWEKNLVPHCVSRISLPRDIYRHVATPKFVFAQRTTNTRH